MTKDFDDIIFCSFYTDDAYYTMHGERLKSALTALGIQHEIGVIKKAPDENGLKFAEKRSPLFTAFANVILKKKYSGLMLSVIFRGCQNLFLGRGLTLSDFNVDFQRPSGWDITCVRDFGSRFFGAEIRP